MSGTRVTATSVDDPTETETVTIENDYVLTCDGSCYQHSVVAHANGTHVITIKGRHAL